MVNKHEDETLEEQSEDSSRQRLECTVTFVIDRDRLCKVVEVSDARNY